MSTYKSRKKIYHLKQEDGEQQIFTKFHDIAVILFCGGVFGQMTYATGYASLFFITATGEQTSQSAVTRSIVDQEPFLHIVGESEESVRSCKTLDKRNRSAVNAQRVRGPGQLKTNLSNIY